MRVRLLPYKMGSESAKLLARGLGYKRIFAKGSRFIQRRGDIIINWGCSSTDNQSIILPTASVLNKFSSIKAASNKLTTLNLFNTSGISCPTYTIHHSDAKTWIEQGHIVYCRKTLTGKGGYGIVIANTIEELVDAPLYTKGVKAGFEYRVHVFNGEVIDYVKKGRKRLEEGEERPSHLIRNYTKGWIFIREGIELPEMVKQESIRAVKALGLDFGAVDIAQVKNSEDVVVYEVNTAPGLQGTTLEKYIEAIQKYINGGY